MDRVTSLKLSGLPPRNRVAWVPLEGGGYWGCDLYGTITIVTRSGVLAWQAVVYPFMGESIRDTRSRSLTAARCRAKVDRLVREAQAHGRR